MYAIVRSAAVFVCLLLGPLFGSADEAARPELPAKDKLHVYLLMGQSNMAGRGQVDPQQTSPHPRVLKLDQSDAWTAATDPLHFDKPAIAGVGPGSGFGPALAEADESVVIGLVPCAVGGTPLSRWEADGDLYQDAVRRAKIAMRDGTLKGVIWHQGEADAGREATATTYGRRLAGMIAALRRDLAAPELPIVVGELGEFIGPDRLAHAAVVNAALRELPSQVERTAFVSSRGLKAKPDGIHFDAASAREFGVRYAQAMQKLQNSQKSP
jgi:hypothetical protein